MATGDRVGIIAGSGELPLHLARNIHGSGKGVHIAALLGAADASIEDPAWTTAWHGIHSLQELLDGLRGADVTEVVLAGMVDHRQVFDKGRFDDRMLRFLNGLADNRGSTILTGLVELLEEEGFRVPSLLDAAPELVPGRGFRAGPEPDAGQEADLVFGWPITRQLADLGIGQTAVFRDRAVVAVEAMEGTDETLQRALRITGGRVTVVKLAAVDHDFRYDVPTIGVNTVMALTGTGHNTLAFEAGRCFVLDPEGVRSLCDRKGVTILGCEEMGSGRVRWGEG
ncbi:MAG: UDP-2,3-diacylglucosamine diphosphatase LpxI [bacterium]|nr:MAG: UDP-2,3-diacylglucosamine diphosphatase LpxI [bacterium]